MTFQSTVKYVGVFLAKLVHLGFSKCLGSLFEVNNFGPKWNLMIVLGVIIIIMFMLGHRKKYKTLPITLNFKPTQKGGLYA